MIHPSDGQTDVRAIACTCYSVYAVARKKVTPNYELQFVVLKSAGRHGGLA